MSEEFRYDYRAAGWVSNASPRHGVRLTSREQARLTDVELIAVGEALARTKGLVDGHVAVGVWTNIDSYVESYMLPLNKPGALDDVIEDKAEFALQSVLRSGAHDGGVELVDAAHWAALAVVYDLADRSGFEILDGGLDDAIKAELVSTLAAIVRRATSQSRTEDMRGASAGR